MNLIGSWKKNRPRKDVARRMMINTPRATTSPAKVAIFLPADSCIDVKLALETGVINKRTFLIIVEKAHSAATKIRAYMSKTFPKNGYAICELELEKLDLENVLEGRKVDYAFLDMCGQITHKVAYWLHKNQDCFTDDAIIGITRYARVRASDPWFSLVAEWMDEQDYFELSAKMEEARGDLTGDVSVKKVSTKTLKTGKYPANELKDIVTRHRFIHFARVACHITMSALSRKEVEIERVFLYKDNSEMHLIILKIKGSKIPQRDILEPIREYDKTLTSYAARIWPTKTEGKKRKRKTKEEIELAKKLSIVVHTITSRRRFTMSAVEKGKITRWAQALGKKPIMVVAGIKATMNRPE